MKIKKITYIFVILLILTSDCNSITNLEIKFWHDYTNPCTPGVYYNGTDCYYWKKKFPKEYYAYRKRMAMMKFRKN